MDNIDTTLAEIARRHFGIRTLEPRGRDSLDFHDLSVGSIAAALRAAFEAGRAARMEEP